MSDKNTNPPALDHMTARIVNELAAALLAPLEHTVAEQAARAAAGADEARRRLDDATSNLQNEFRRLDEDFTVLKTDISAAAQDLHAVRAALKESVEAIERTIGKGFQNEAEPTPPRDHPAAGRTRPRASLPPPVGATFQRGNRKAQKDEETRFQELLKQRLPEWEGFLRASARAQTQELDALSQEISELLRDTRATLLAEFRETFERAFSEKSTAWMQETKNAAAELRGAVARLKTQALLLGWGCVVALLALAVAVWRG